MAQMNVSAIQQKDLHTHVCIIFLYAFPL